jgi:hypothetical protein
MMVLPFVKNFPFDTRLRTFFTCMGLYNCYYRKLDRPSLLKKYILRYERNGYA